MQEEITTRERILREALEVFAGHGYEGARIDRIASRVGINKASLYFHFSSKEEIFRELFRVVVDRYHNFISLLIRQTEGFPTEQRLTMFYRQFLSDSWENVEMDFWNRIYYLPPEFMKDEIYRRTRNDKDAFIEALSGVFEDGISKGELEPLDPEQAALTFYYLITCISLSVDIMSKEQGLHEMDRCFSVFWRGIAR